MLLLQNIQELCVWKQWNGQHDKQPFLWMSFYQIMLLNAEPGNNDCGTPNEEFCCRATLGILHGQLLKPIVNIMSSTNLVSKSFHQIGVNSKFQPVCMTLISDLSAPRVVSYVLFVPT